MSRIFEILSLILPIKSQNIILKENIIHITCVVCTPVLVSRTYLIEKQKILF